jgi:hypothetical protein
MRRFTILTIIGLAVLLPRPALAPTSAQAAELKTAPVPLVPKSIMDQWQKVAWCESHANWTQKHYGPQAFSGALGIKNYVWLANGGRQYGPTAGHASPEEQVLVARQIQRNGGVPNYVPDQDGQCRGW